MTEPKFPEVVVQLSGEDGNAFAELKKLPKLETNQTPNAPMPDVSELYEAMCGLLEDLEIYHDETGRGESVVSKESYNAAYRARKAFRPVARQRMSRDPTSLTEKKGRL